MAEEKGNKFAEGQGGPTKYKPEYVYKAYKLCLLGHTDEDLANFFEVDVATINRWKNDFPSFCESVREGKVVADANVAEGLYKRAIGFSYDEVTFEKIDSKVHLEVTSAGDITKDDAYKKKVVTKMVVPDPGAAMNWLSNRQKDQWRNRQDITTDGEKLKQDDIDYSKLSDNVLKAIIEAKKPDDSD